MADIKIADLNLGTVLGAGDALVLVQGDTTLQISGENVALGVKAIADLADKAYVDAIVAGAPEMLDTLNELAAAIGDDPNFSSSIRTILDSKLPTANFGLEFWNALSGVTTYHIAEDTNLYFTTARARQSISAGAGISYNNSTGVISSTITQYTDALARGAISAGTGISYNNSTGVISSTITQYTNALARGAISAGAGISYNNSTGVISSSIVNSDGEVVIANGNGHGGAGYAGVLTLINTSNGATNINKFIRLNNNGNFEIINSAYSASIFTVTDSGQTQLGTGGLRFSDGSVMTSAGALGSTPTFTSVTTGMLNVQNVTFTGTGAVTITSGNDLNLVAAGNVAINGNPLVASATTDTTNASNITSGTLSNSRLNAIPNSSLANSSITINGTSIALGGTGSITTTNVSEGTNLYYTDARARSALSGGANISYNNGTGVIAVTGLATVATSGSYNDLTNVKREESFDIKNSSFNALSSGRYGINTSSSAVIATLPSSPAVGDSIFFVDLGGKFGTNNLTIARNGNPIMDLASNLIISTDYESLGLCWNGTSWVSYQRKTIGYKTITTQTIYSPQNTMSSIQSSAFNSATVAIQIRSSIVGPGSGGTNGLLHYKIGSNPTATYTDSPIVPLLTGQAAAGEILTINVRAGDKIAIYANYLFSQAGGWLYITELGY